jgi:hypothetical protein
MPLGAGQVLVGPAGALYLARALAQSTRAARRDGIRPPADVTELQAVLDTAAGEAQTLARETAKARREEQLADSASITSSGDPAGAIDAATMASLMGFSPQWARALLRRGAFASASRRAGHWSVDRAEVEALLLKGEGPHAHDDRAGTGADQLAAGGADPRRALAGADGSLVSAA